MSEFKLSMKVYERDGHRYLCPIAMANPTSTNVTALAMSDDKTIKVELTDEEWNALPYHWFVDAGPAPKPEHRTITLPFPRPKET